MFLGSQYKDIMNADIIAACTRKLAECFIEIEQKI